MDQQRGIVTPEAVVLEFETAGAGSRFLARIIDLLIQVVGLFIILAVLSIPAGIVGPTASTIIGFIVMFLGIVGYAVIFEALWGGKTVGKAIFGLRVVTVEGAPIQFRHAATRGIMGVAEVFFTLGSMGVISIVLARDNQRLGDVFAGTIVLNDRSSSRPAIPVRFPAPPGLEGYTASLDVAGIKPRQYTVVRSFLMRVQELTPEARVALALRLANPITLAMHHNPPEDLNPELFLACVASSYQLRHGAPPLPWEVIHQGVLARPQGYGPLGGALPPAMSGYR